VPIPNDRAVPGAHAVAGRALIIHYEIERVAMSAVTGIMDMFAALASEEEKAEFAGGLTDLVSVTIDLLKDLRLWSSVTLRERRIFETSPDALTPDDHAAVQREGNALICLLWALGRIDALPETDESADGSPLSDVFATADDESDAVVGFLDDATLRPEWEIAAARDAVAGRMRAIVRSGASSNDMATATSVLAARLKALDWMCGSLALSDWDEAPPQEL